MKKNFRIFFLLIALSIFFYLLGSSKIFQSFSKTQKDYQYLSLFSEVISLVKINYVEEIELETKFQGAYSAMLNSLDEFSSYLTPWETEIFQAYQSGHSFCTGLFGNKVLDYFYVNDVRKDSPAFEAGLENGDLIKGINGQSIYAKSFWQMYLKLQTEKKENLRLRVLKKAYGREIEIKVDTEAGKDSFVLRQSGKDSPWLELTCFNEDCYLQLKKYLVAVKPEKIILDLRWYRGGTFAGFQKIAGQFLEKETPLTLKTRKGNIKVPLGSDENYHGKIVVIIGQSTIMYGEILAALLKAQGEKSSQSIVLLGQQTGRFNARLKHILLEDGSSILLTEGLYLINDKSITRTGIKPQIKLKDEELNQLEDRAVGQLKSL